MTRLRAALLVMLVGLQGISLGAPVLADDLSNAQQHRDQLSNQLSQNQRQQEQVRSQQRRNQDQLNSLEGQIAAAEARLSQENAQLDQILGKIDQTQRDLEAKKEEVARRQAILNQRTRTLYKQGGDFSFLDALFSSNSFSDLVDRFGMMSDVTRADQLLVQQLQRDKAAIEELGAALARSRDDQKSVVAGIQTQTNQLGAQYAQAAALRNALNIEQTDLQRQQAEARRQLAQANAEIAALIEARKRAHSSGYFAWPGVQGPISQGFGCTDYAAEPPPPPGYTCPSSRPYFHTGIDIAGPYGAEVDAADGGLAYTYVSNYGYGLHIIVVHANGFATIYGHLSSFAIQSGQGVSKGQAIGYEGSTGNSSGPHLHFEVRLNDVPQDPCRYVGC